MTDEEETESSVDEDDEGIKKENQERIHTTLVILGGAISAIISYLTFGFSDFISVLPAIGVAVLVLGIFAAVFDTPSKKKIAFTVIITIISWFVAGTFILRLL